MVGTPSSLVLTPGPPPTPPMITRPNFPTKAPRVTQSPAKASRVSQLPAKSPRVTQLPAEDPRTLQQVASTATSGSGIGIGSGTSLHEPAKRIKVSKKIDVPTPSFRVVPPDLDPVHRARHEAGPSSSLSFQHFGYNAVPSFYKPPAHYVRYIEPIESDLEKKVEYDMDEQDREWVDAFNEERHRTQLDKVGYELFEIVMDRLEKEYFNLMKRVPTLVNLDLPVEDSRCSICDDGEGENANAIVFCDGCNLAVHQDCYGVPYIPEGQWLCRKCTVEPENPVDCIFCPGEAGAFKQTTEGAWAHLLCAIWIPEVGVANPVYMEPIEGVEGIPKGRWKLNCSICKVRGGACIQCENRSCFTAFHVTCGRSQGWLTSMKSLTTEGTLKAYCNRHLPARQLAMIEEKRSEARIETEARLAVSPKTNSHKRKRQEDYVPVAPVPVPTHSATLTKSARAHAKSYNSGPPLVPAVIVKSVLEYANKVKVRKMKELVERVCRYWSLKREARRGAPLLKRLYLEPWTTSIVSKEQTDADKAKRLEYLAMVRNDIERVRMLTELAKKREREKLRQVQIIEEIVNEFVVPYKTQLRVALQKISALDRSELFTHPVSRSLAPDYYDVIKYPMSWTEIDEKLDQNRYLELSDFQHNVYLVLNNAMTYNPPDHPYHKLAARIKKSAEGIFASLTQDIPGGTLEATPVRLAALLQEDEDGKDYLHSLFSFELRKLRPPTPPPPPKRPKLVLSSEELKARKDAREAKWAASKPATGVRSTRALQAIEDQARHAAKDAERIATEAVQEAKEIADEDARKIKRRADEAIKRAERRADEAAKKAKRKVDEAARKAKRKADEAAKKVERPDDEAAMDAERVTNETAMNVEQVADEAAHAATRPIASRRDRRRVAPTDAIADIAATSIKRSGKGVAVMAPYPPTNVKRRGKSETTLASEVHKVESTDEPRRPDVGSVLPEGSRRANSSSMSPLPTRSRSGRLRLAVRQAQPGRPAEPIDRTVSNPPQEPYIVNRPRDVSPAISVLSSLSSLSDRDSVEEPLRPPTSELEQISVLARSSSHRKGEQISVDASQETGRASKRVTRTAPTAVEAVQDDVPHAEQPYRNLRRAKVPRPLGWDGPPVEPSVERKNTRSGIPRGPTETATSTSPAKKAEKVVATLKAPKSKSNAKKAPKPVEDGQMQVGAEMEATDAVEPVSAGEVPEALQAGDPGEAVAAIETARQVVAERAADAEAPREAENDEEDDPVRQERLASLKGTNRSATTVDGWMDPYPEGTLVWARIEGFPFFPAEVVDADYDYYDIPHSVWKAKPESTDEERVWLIRFFDAKKSFGWCKQDKLEPLAEDDGVDQKHMNPRVKSKDLRNAVKKAYMAATANMEATTA